MVENMKKQETQQKEGRNAHSFSLSRRLNNMPICVPKTEKGRTEGLSFDQAGNRKDDFKKKSRFDLELR